MLQNLAQEKLRPLVLRVVEEFLGLVGLDDLAAIHEYDGIRNRFRKAHLVSHAEHGHATLGKFDHDIEHFLDHLGVERRGRLVEQHDARVHAKAARDRDTLLLTARKLARIFGGLVGDLDALEVFHRDFLGFLAWHLAHPDRCKAAVLENGKVREEVEVLEAHANLAAYLVDILDIVGELDTIDDDLASLVFLEPVDAPQQGRLARSAGANDDHHLLRVHVEADAAQGVDLDVAARDFAPNLHGVVGLEHGGDAALCEYTERFDRLKLEAAALEVSKAEIEQALAAVDQDTLATLQLAADRIATFHRRQKEETWLTDDEPDIRLGQMVTPLDRIGIYVPGGKAAYPSSVLMNALPAKVAGVKRLVACSSPGKEKRINPAILYTMVKIGADEIYCLGGAQAIAAMAYGTQTIDPVDLIVGPGNQWVMEAKRQVFGTVGIDFLAGPSECMVIADETGRNWRVAEHALIGPNGEQLARLPGHMAYWFGWFSFYPRTKLYGLDGG